MANAASATPRSENQPVPTSGPSHVLYRGITAALALGFLGALFLISQRNYLLFHVIVELCTIGMAIAIFTVAWNTRHLLDHHGFLLLGVSYLGIGLLTLTHTLAYKGMALLTDTGGANMATQLWIAARFLEGLAFIGFPLSLRRRYPTVVHVLLGAALPALLLLMIVQWRLFPDCFLEGTGLTRFKIISEYLFCLMGLAALTLLFQRRHLLDHRVYRLLFAGIALSIGGELFFTLYKTVTSLVIVAGHYLHLISIFLLYQGLVQSSLTRPLDTLFLSLRRQEGLLAARLRLSEMSVSLSLDDLLARVMDEAEALTGSIIGFFHFVEADQETLSLQAWSRSTTSNFCTAEGKGLHYPAAQAGVWVDCLRERRAVIHNDYPSLPHRKRLPPGHAPVHRELVVPIFRGELITAIFGVGNKSDDYDQNDIDLVTALGDLAWDIILRKRAELALRESEERFRLCFERSPVGTVLLRPDFRFQKSNESFSRMIGYSEEELAGLTFADITHPEERQRDLQQVQRLLSGEITRYDIEKRYIHKNGTTVWARVNVTLVRDSEKKPLFFLPVVEDITDRKKAEQELLESQRRYQRVIDTAREGIWMMNELHLTTFVNEHMATMLGLAPAEMVGRPVEDFMFSEDLDRHFERMAARQQGQGGYYEHRFRHCNGQPVWTIVSAVSLLDESGNFAGSFAMFTNISARKEAEQRLMERTAYLQAIFRASPVGIGVVNNRVIGEANNRLCEITGYTLEELVGCNARLLYPSEEEYRRVGEEKYAQISRHGTGTVETYWRCKDGRIIEVLLSSTPIDPSDLSRGVTFAALDISERKEAERQAQQQAEFTRRILNSTDAHIAILDAHGIIIDVNTSWTRFGYENGVTDPNGIGPGTNYFLPYSAEFGDITNADPTMEGIRQVQRGERETFQIEYPCHSPTTKRWFTMRVLPLTGAPGQVLISHTNITNLKQIEEQLTAALTEKNILLREVHHRVKNNLAAVISLLDMQRRLFEDARSRDILSELGNRIRSMSLIHEKLYQSHNLARIDFADYLRSLVSHLRTSFGASHVDCHTDVRDIELPLDLAVPCGMIVNELVTNVMKHAFPEKKPAPGRSSCRLEATLRREQGLCILAVADNGVGLPTELQWENAKTLGMMLIRMLGRHQLGGSYSVDSREGLTVTLTFPEKRG